MAVSVRTLDDAAWVSVNDQRVAGASEVWPVAGGGCACSLSWLAVEAVVEVGVDGRCVDARVHGHCVTCGAASTTGWLPVGRVTAAGFEPVVGVRRSRQFPPVSAGTGDD